MNVFLVDNDQYSLNLYRQYLGSQGYNDVSIFNNAKSYTIYMDQRPDVVFLGNSLGQKVGLELLKSFKSINPEIEVILLPHAPYATNTETIVNDGADEYVLDYMTDVLGRLKMMNRFGHA